jgi:predicted component of type VI protein secretion system
MEVRFVIISPPRQKNSIAVRLPIVVGRGEEAKFRIQQDSVSRRHCEFFEEDGGVFVRDVGSTNGTLLDGERIASGAACAVASGMRVQVGGLVFRVEYQSAKSVATKPAPEADTLPVAAEAGEATGDDAAPAAAAAEATPAGPDAPEAEGLAGLAVEPAAAPPADGSFGFLAAEAEEPAPEADDGKLDDFFKSLQ